MAANYVDVDSQSFLRSNSNTMFMSNGFANFAGGAPPPPSSTSHVAPILTPALDQFLNRRNNADTSAAQNVIEELERHSVIRYQDLQIGDSIGEGSHSEFDLLVKETAIMSQLSHPNVVEFIGICRDTQRTTDYVIITAFEAGGSLRERIERKSHTIDSLFQCNVATDIARGMQYLHSFKPLPIIHRDLTTANVLLSASNRAMLCDFGLSRIKNESGSMTAAMGSLPYMAPECFRGEHYDQSVDVYSYAIVLWELISLRRMPPQGITCHLWATQAALDGRRPSMAGFSARWSNLITKCWAPAPADRLSFNDIVAYCESTLVVVGGQAPPTAFSASPTSSSLSLGMLTSFGRSASMSPQASLSNHYAEPNLHGANNNSMTRQSLTHQASSMHQHQQHQLSQSFQSQAVRSQQPTISNNNNNNNNYVTTEDSPTRFVIENTVILNGHNGAVSCLHTNEGSDSVLSGSTDATIMIWSDANGARLHAMTAHNAYVFCLETGDVQSTPVMISGSRDTSIRIWDQRGSMLLALNGHTGGVRDVKLSGTRLVSASEDHSVVVWDVVRATAVRRYAAAHRGVAYSCAFVDADANLVASGGDDGVVRLWDLRVASSTMASESSNVSNNGSSDGSVAQLRRHTAGVQRVRIASGNAMELASAGKDCRAIRWDLRRLAAVQDFVGHRNTIFDLILQADTLITAAADGYVNFYDLHSGALQFDFKAHSSSILCLATLGNSVYTGAVDKTIRKTTLRIR